MAWASQKLNWMPLLDNQSMIHKDDAIRYIIRKLNFMSNNNHCSPLICESAHYRQNFTYQLGIKSRGWFVKKK